jgi:hypothetical protein
MSFIRATKGARNVMLNLEHMDDESLKWLSDIYEMLGTQARGEKIEKQSGEGLLKDSGYLLIPTFHFIGVTAQRYLQAFWINAA